MRMFLLFFSFFSFFSSLVICFSQTNIDVDLAGQSYTNIDDNFGTPVVDTYSGIDISECSSIQFSVDYSFNLAWEGSGNMEMSDECGGCTGDPTDPVGGGCNNCWDFMWMQFFIDGNEVDSELIGESGTTDAEQNGNYTTSIFCTQGITEAEIIISNQNWAATETNSFSNVIIVCWEGVPDITSNDPICGSENLDLIGDAGDVSIVTDWSWTNDGNGSIDDDTAQNTFATGPEDGEEYTLMTTDVNDCDATSMVVVSIVAVPDIFPAGPLQLCDDLNDDEESFDLTSLDDDVSGGIGSVQWFEDMNMTNPITTPWDYISGITSVYAIVDDNGCLSLEEEIDLDLLIVPEPDASSNFILFCVGDGEDLELDEIGDFGDSWEWSGPDGFTAFIQDPVVSIINNSQAGTYIVTATDVSGMCSATSEITISIGDLPSAVADANATELCAGSTLNLDEIGGDATTWSWSGPDGFTSNNQDPSINNIGSTNAGTYTVTVTDGSSCTNTSSVAIVIGSIVAGISGGADLCPNECTDDDSDLEFILSGGTQPYDVVISVNSITLPGFAIDIDQTVRVCHDESLILPDIDFSGDPILVSLPGAFLPLTLQLISVTDANGCDAMIDAVNNIINLDLLDAPSIIDPNPDPYCLDQTELIDLTIMEDEITGGDGSLTVTWYSDEDLNDEINNPENYDINDGTTIYAIVDDGNCFSESVEIELPVFATPVITVTSDIIDCANPYELPDVDDIADIVNSINPVFYLDQNLSDGPYTSGSYIDPEGLSSIYLFDNSGPCSDVEEVIFMVTTPLLIISPEGQLGGCGSIILPLPELEGPVISFEYNTENDGSGDSYFDGEEIFESDNILSLFLIVIGDNGCQVQSEIEIILDSSIDYQADIPLIICNHLVLPDINPMTSNVAYYSESQGTGDVLLPGDTLFGISNMVTEFDFFLYDPSQDPVCAPEVLVSISIEQGPQINISGDTLGCGFLELPEIVGLSSDSATYSLFPFSDQAQHISSGDTIFDSQTIYLLDTIGLCTYLDSFNVQISNIPYTGENTILNICEGFDVFNFNLMEQLGFPDENGQWSFPFIPDFNPSDSSDINFSPIPVGSYDFVYAIEDTCGLTSSIFNLIVIDAPYTREDSIMALCQGAPPQDLMALLNNPEPGGQWSQIAGPSAVDLSDSTSVLFGGAVGGSYAFTYTISAVLVGDLCGAVASSLIINIEEGPNAGLDIQYTACLGDIVDISSLLSVDADSGGNFEPDGFLLSGSDWNTASSQPGNTYDIEYIILNNSGNCENDTASIAIFLTENISAGSPSMVNQVCEDELISLSDFIEDESPGGIFALASDHLNPINDIWEADATTIFSYIIDGSGGCPSDSIDFILIVNPLPDIQITGSASELCVGIEDCVEINFTSNQFVAADMTLTEIGSGDQWPVSQAVNMSSVLIVCADRDKGEISQFGDTLFIGSDPGQMDLIPSQIMDVFTYCSVDLDSGLSLSFDIYQSYESDIESTICVGESILIDNLEYFSSEDISLQSVDGCDSLIHLVINNYPSEPGLTQGVYCVGETINILGTDFSANTMTTMSFSGASVFGCDSIVDIDITFEDAVFGGFNAQFCPEEQVTIEGVIFDINNQSGEITIDNGSVNGCDSTIMVNLDFYQEAISDMFLTLCEGESIQIGIDTYDSNNSSGTTILFSQSINGCDSIIEVDLSFMSNSIANVDDIYCQDQDIIINGNTYNASNPSGQEILNSGNAAGCDSTINISLSFDIPSAEIGTLPSCPDGTEATLIIESTNGLDFPVELYLNGMSFGQFNSIPIEVNVANGNYNIQLVSGACQYEDDILLESIDTSGTDIVIDNLSVNVYQLSLTGVSNPSNISWTPANTLNCSDCPNPVASISQNTTYTVSFTTENGCLINLERTIIYTPVVHYYIPNIIDINNPPNDKFFIQSNFSELIVQEMRIFDRWGNLVFEVEQIPVNQADFGWNGLVNNQEVEQGVFVYVIQVLNTAGELETMTGSFTIIR